MRGDNLKEKAKLFYKEMSLPKLIFCFSARVFIIACIFISAFIFKSPVKAGESAALFLCSFLFEGYFLISKNPLSERGATIECAFIAFLLFAGVLGSVFSFFETFASYDIFTHSLSGILCAEIIILVATSFSEKKGFKFSSLSLWLFCFIFTVAVAALWEVWEFIAFTLIKYANADSFSHLLAQFGFGSAPVWKSTVSDSAAVVSERYDTFSDAISAVIFGSVYAFVKIDRKKHI